MSVLLHVGKRKGFTLIEMVVVMVLIAILGAIALPRFFNTSTFNDSLFDKSLISVLRYAQKLAMITSCDTQVQLSGSTITLNQRAGCTAGQPFTLAVVNPMQGTSGYQVKIPTGVAVSFSTNPFYFDKTGRALNASAAVTTINITSGTHTVTVAGTTGFAYDPTQ